MLSLALKSTIIAYEKGYRATNDGGVVSPVGRKRKLQIENIGGYKRYSFSVSIGNYKTYPVNVHQLVAFQKFGEELFTDGVEIRHIDGNSLNNSWDNIELGTRQENELDKPEKLRKELSVKASTYTRKFTDNEMEEIRKFHNGSYKETMKAFGISSKGTLHRILNVKYQTKI